MTIDLDKLVSQSLKPKRKKWHWSQLPDPITWIPKNFYLYDTHEKFEFFPIQEKAIRIALEREPDGAFTYQTVLWSWIKKSAKSTVIAAIAHWMATNKPHAQVALIANDLRQAQSRVGFYLRKNIELAHDIGKEDQDIDPSIFDIRLPRRETEAIEYPNGSVIEMLPTDPKGEAGGNHDLLVYSELWGWSSQAHQDMWAEMTISPTKYGRAQRWIDTYAGFSGESPVLEFLYEQVVNDENCIDPEYQFYANKRSKIFATWVTKARFPWQTDAYYAEQRSTLTDNQFRRMHENQWVTSEQAFLPDMKWWTRLKDTNMPPLTKYTPMVVAIDAGTDSDCFAIVGVTIDPRRKDDRCTLVRYVRVWYPDQTQTDIFSEPVAELRRLARDYDVWQFTYDPWQMKYLAGQLKDEGLGSFEPFTQLSGERNEADKLLFDMIREGRIRHPGHPDLDEHMANANREEGRADQRIRITQRSERLKNDAVIALSMANKRALDKIPY